ncbi:MFS transporter [Arvimicrobium flavum]|uniref:MFS transporter n=1 Tax=Arvimicrobium flavum TaxID=3393320 RepID=UPI00237BB5F9|nr:MFS transporter [Mesorhizobium shangrilense]
MALPPLSPAQLAKPRRFELRVSLIFAALFIPQGVHLPYFPLWLESKGLDAEHIAIVLSAPMFLRVFTTPLITALADRAKDRASVLVAMVAMSLILSIGYFFTSSFTAILIVSLLLSIVWTPHSTLADSLALSGVRRFGSNYAHMRIWGSAAFLAANFFGGVAISLATESSVPAMISAGLVGTLAACLLAPRLGKPRRASPLSASAMQKADPSLFTPYFLLCVVGAGLINSSHGFMYGFASIYWKSIGIDGGVVGLLWTASVVAEVGIFMAFTRVFGRTPSSILLGLAGLGAIVRWVAYPLVWPSGAGVAGFFAVQGLHAVSTGLILLGVQKLIAETIDEDKMGAAQGVAFFASGLFMALVTLASGAVYENMGANGFYVMAAVALVGVALIACAGRQPQSAG